jgi:hypothetical protein
MLLCTKLLSLALPDIPAQNCLSFIKQSKRMTNVMLVPGCCPHTAVPTHHHLLLQALLQNLASGLTVAEAAWQAGQQLTGMELDHIRSHIIVMGAPTLTASIGGSRGGKGGAAGAKKK